MRSSTTRTKTSSTRQRKREKRRLVDTSFIDCPINVRAYRTFCATSNLRPGDTSFKNRFRMFMRRHLQTMEHWDHIPIYPTTIHERLRYEHVRLTSREDIEERIEEQIDDVENDYEYWLDHTSLVSEESNTYLEESKPSPPSFERMVLETITE